MTYDYTFSERDGLGLLGIPWRQRHAFDDYGVAEHDEQEGFLSALLQRAGVTSRSTAPGEFAFDTELAQRCAAAALGAALRVPALLSWGGPVSVSYAALLALGAIDTLPPASLLPSALRDVIRLPCRGALALDRRVPCVEVDLPALVSAPHNEWRDTLRIGCDVASVDPLARRLVEECLGANVWQCVAAALRVVMPVATEQKGLFERSWHRTVERGFCAGDLAEVDTITVSRESVVVEGYSHSYGVRSGEARRVVALTDVATSGTSDVQDIWSRVIEFANGVFSYGNEQS